MKERTILDVMPFGRHKGKLIGTVIKEDPEYISWAVNNVDGFVLDDQAVEYLEENL